MIGLHLSPSGCWEVRRVSPFSSLSLAAGSALTAAGAWAGKSVQAAVCATMSFGSQSLRSLLCRPQAGQCLFLT